MEASRCVPDCGGNESPIRAAIPVSLAALSVPGSPSFALPIRGLILMRVAAFCGAVVSLIGSPEGWRLRGDERRRKADAGRVAAEWIVETVESQNRAVLRTGSIETRHPQLGSCTATFGSLLVTTENKAVAGRRELMGSRRAL